MMLKLCIQYQDLPNLSAVLSLKLDGVALWVLNSSWANPTTMQNQPIGNEPFYIAVTSEPILNPFVSSIS